MAEDVINEHQFLKKERDGDDAERSRAFPGRPGHALMEQALHRFSSTNIRKEFLFCNGDQVARRTLFAWNVQDWRAEGRQC
jgi:predicted deacylase